MAKKPKSDQHKLDALVRQYRNDCFRRPKYKIARQALLYEQADLRDVEKTLKWLQAKPWFDKENKVGQALIAIRDEARNNIKRLTPLARGESVNPPRVASLLIAVSKLLNPHGVRKGQRSEHARDIVQLLKPYNINRKPYNVNLNPENIATLLDYHRRK